MNNNKIRNHSNAIYLAGFLFLFTFLISCNDDEEVKVETVSIGFPSDSVSIAENAGEVKTAIVLSNPSNGEGSFQVQLSGATYGTDYTTIPDGSSGTVSIEVEEGTLFRSFSIVPVDNEDLNEDKNVTLTLLNAESAIETGSQTSLVVTIEDDEEEAPVNFELADLMISESTGAITVNLPLDFPADGDGTIDVELTGDGYSTAYTTSPEGASGKFTLPVNKGESSASFSLTTIDNEVVNGDAKKVSFEISNATGGLLLGDKTSFEVTIADDESPSLANFKDATSSIIENAAQFVTEINFAFPLEADGSFEVNIMGGTYGTDFSTIPEGTSGKFTVNGKKGDEKASFTFTPIDNELIDAEDRVITFTLSNGLGGIELGDKISFVVTMSDNEVPTSIDFRISEQSLLETSDAVEVFLDLGMAATASGTVELAITTGGTVGTDFSTTPAAVDGVVTLNVPKGAANTSFSFTPTDNGIINPTEITASFRLRTPSEALFLGTKREHTITIIDDEKPLDINFQQSSQSIVENSEAATITLDLEAAALLAGTIDINLTGATYGTEYTTVPDGSSGTLTLNVAKGADDVSFTVTPVNNDIAAGNRSVTFTLANAMGGVAVGTDNNSLTLTITDKDRAITTISDIRNLFDGTNPSEIAAGTVIRGVVVSSSEATANQNIVIQDASAGIVINFTSDHTFARGDELEVDISGTTIDRVNSLVQLGGNATTGNALKVNSAQLPAPKVITLAEANSGNFESQFVSVESVYFIEANGVKTLNEDNTLSEGTNELTTFIFASSFNSNVIPFGIGTVSGIMGAFNNNPSILPQAASEIFANNPSVSLTVTGMLTDFGTVVSDGFSPAQSITVETSSLLGDVIVDAPANFEASLSETTGYASEITIDQATSGSTTVYVRFAPTSTIAGIKDGQLTVTTLQAAETAFNVTGNESSASSSNLLFVDNFDYGTTAGDFVNDGTGIGTDNWEAHSGAGSNPHQYLSSSLSLTGYPSSGVGGSITTSTGEDVNANLAMEVSSGKVYASALVNIPASATTRDGGDYFLHFIASTSFELYSRVTIQDDGAGNLLFGIRENSEDAVFASGNFTYNTTYLVVFTYDFDNEKSELHVLTTVPATEPTPIAESSNTENAPTVIREIAVRGSRNNPAVNVDGIRVALDWASIIGN